jgi:hypothetical protein
MNFFLSTYTLRIYNKKIDKDLSNDVRRNRPLKLDKFDEAESDAYKVCKRYLVSLKRWPIIDSQDKSIFKLLQYKFYDSKRIITGFFETGYYGLSSKLIDIENNTFRVKKSTEADAMPFFFLFFFPKDRDEGIIILERIGNLGVRTLMTKLLADKFSKEFKDLKIEINSLIPEEIIKQIIKNGSIKKLRFIKFRKPDDKADLLKNVHFEDPVNLEIVVAGKNLNVKDKILSIFNKGATVKTLFELNNMDFEYDTIKAQVQQEDGRNKIVNLSDFIKVRNYINITHELRFETGGHPEFTSIESVAMKLCKEIHETIG